jgi:hypothetical protein
MKTDTPRTSDIWGGLLYAYPFLSNPVDETALMERELTAARAEIAEWRILNGWGGTPEIINDFIKGQQTRIHLAQNLEEELDRVTEQRDRLAEAMRQMTPSGDIVICSRSATKITTNEQ